MNVITTKGRRLVANAVQNADLFWAVRGGGGGLYGVVTEYVPKTHHVPENMVTGGVAFYTLDWTWKLHVALGLEKRAAGLDYRYGMMC